MEKEVLLNFVLVGHVDHGKSTCGGRILMDTGTVTDTEIRKAQEDAEDNKMRTWWLAYLLDESPEERTNGKTHEYVVKSIDRGNYVINMIDVPGHNQFITQMIYGTSKADVVVLICSAKQGEFEKGLKGQTYEHLILSKCMGINNLVIAINKIDTIGWNTEEHDSAVEIYNKIKDKITSMIKRLRFKNVYFVPISAFNGWNIVHSMDTHYPSLFDLIETGNWDKKQGLDKIKTKTKTKTINAKCMFMNIKTLITVGFTAVLHSGEIISECTIVEIRTKSGKPFVTAKDVDYIDVTIKLSKKIELENYIIMRTNESTVAIGRIY